MFCNKLYFGNFKPDTRELQYFPGKMERKRRTKKVKANRISFLGREKGFVFMMRIYTRGYANFFAGLDKEVKTAPMLYQQSL